MSELTEAVANLCIEANFNLSEDVMVALNDSLLAEESSTGKEILSQLVENAEIARSERLPVCQDTGIAVVFLEVGQEVLFVGGNLCDAINEGVRRGYEAGFLRKSIVSDPVERVNTGDNTPAVIHLEIVPGERVRVVVAPKGGGSENMSALKMLTPAQGAEGIVDFVVETVCKAGPNACPPVVVGVGIGGTFEKTAYLAKKALLRDVGKSHSNPVYAEMEKEILMRVNKLGIGPQGFGGRVTALAVHIEVFPCHMASLPVAVNLNCHVSRHKEILI